MNAEEYIVEHWIKNEIWKHLNSKEHQRRLNLVSSFLTGQTYMDVGCALGHSIEHMKRHRPGLRDWSGLDFSKTAIKEAKKLFPDIPFYYAKNFNLKSVCGEFDSVTCLGTIEHIEDDRGFVKGLLDITKETLIVTTTMKKIKGEGHIRVYVANRFYELFKTYFHIIFAIWPYYYVVVKKRYKKSDIERWLDFSEQCRTLFHRKQFWQGD